MRTPTSQPRHNDGAEAETLFRQRLAALAEGRISASAVRFLSDLSRAEQAIVRRYWLDLPLDQRSQIVTTLAEMAEMSVDLDFRRVFLVALDDNQERVVAAAIDGLWEDESPGLLRRLIELYQSHQSELVKTTILRSLARFALLMVTGKIDEADAPQLRPLLLKTAADPTTSVEQRRRALEAVAVFTNDETIKELIAAAAGAPQLETRASALFAMGRNLDPVWLEPVLAALASPAPMLRYEAARASGELGSQRAVPGLLEMLSDSDREAQLAAVQALGKLGGRAAGTALRKLLQSEDEVLRDAAEEALDELTFGADPLHGI